MSTKNVRKENKFVRYMKGPIKILARARNFYVHSLTGCAEAHVVYGNAMACPTLYPTSLPRSFSANSSYSNCSYRDDDMRELIRIASTRSLTGKPEVELLRSRKSPPDLGGGGAAAVTRSRTVAIRRIDEDKPYEFGGVGDDVAERPLVYTRSRSYAASRKSRIV